MGPARLVIAASRIQSYSAFLPSWLSLWFSESDLGGDLDSHCGFSQFFRWTALRLHTCSELADSHLCMKFQGYRPATPAKGTVIFLRCYVINSHRFGISFSS